MTVLIPYGRTLSKQLPLRSGLLTRLLSSTALPRVAQPQINSRQRTKGSSSFKSVSFVWNSQRSYAAAGRPAGKPKAHTGRTTAKKTTKPKPKKKATKPKRKAAKPKPKKVKKPLSAAGMKRKERATRAELKRKALYNKEPKQEPQSAWVVYTTTQLKGVKTINDGSALREVADRYRNLSPEERETLNHTANENKVKNESAYKSWVQSFTPLQIKEANAARAHLLREAKANGVKRKAPFYPIKDERLVARPASAWAIFIGERTSTGDYKGMTGAEAFKLIAREYQQLPAAEKQKYEDEAKASKTRYLMEYKTVYGVEPPVAKPRTKATSS